MRSETAMYLFFDTETTGIPLNRKALLSDSRNWPRVVQLAWLMQDEQGNELGFGASIVKPLGFTIPSDAAHIHGITTEKAAWEGRPLDEVMAEFSSQVSGADILVAHNMDFDEKVIGAELFRLGMANAIKDKKRLCTMWSSMRFCAIPGSFGGYKWPKLDELHRKLFGQGFSGAHDAVSDMRATAKCFRELRRRGVV